MHRLAMTFSLAVLFASSARAQLPAAFTCVIDDVTEVYDGDHTLGHTASDLGGYTPDQAGEVDLSVQGEWLKLQNFAAGKALKTWNAFKVVLTARGASLTSLVAASPEPGSGAAQVLTLIYDGDTQKYGLTLATSRYWKPKARGGEAYVGVDVTLGHCTPS